MENCFFISLADIPNWRILFRFVYGLRWIQEWSVSDFIGSRSSFFCSSSLTFMQLLVNLESKWKCPDQECLPLLSMFLDDQREVSCPLQDQHLLPFGHSAPSLLTLCLKNKNKSHWGGSNDSKMLMGLCNIVSL